MDQDSEERTLPPSAQRLAEAGRQGILPVVTELTAGVGLLGGAIFLSASSSWWQKEMMTMLRDALSAMSRAPSLNLANLGLLQISALLHWTAPLFVLLLLLMLLPRTLLGGFHGLALQWSGGRSTFSLPTAIAQMVLFIVLLIAILMFVRNWFRAPRVPMIWGLLTLTVIGLAWAAAMGWWQWWRYRQQLLMSPHERLREQQEQAPRLRFRRRDSRV